jgi:rRNA small subunit pseudouridine methyltransferase Nep1
VLYLILVESALEPIPERLEHEPLILKHAKKKGKIPSELILDVSLHHTIIKKLDKHKKRGRPDIIHRCLLYALNTPLNRSGLLSIYIHTINDIIIKVNPEVRLPRNYNRFIGLMEQLFNRRKVPLKGRSLLEIIDSSLEELISDIGNSYKIILTENGTPTLPNNIFRSYKMENKYLIMIGAFSSGNLDQKVLNLTSNWVKIDPEPLNSLVVLSKVFNAYENSIGLTKKRLNL